MSVQPRRTQSPMPQKNEYVLARGYLASVRLNFQFHLWREAIGFNMHPQIQLKEGNKVADIATGTGIWPCEVARQAPSSVQFDGFDISDAQFPHPTFLPKNVTLSKLDATLDPPESLYGKYDVVHIRLLMAVVENNDPMPWLDHCTKLLKPGGFLQWDEMDPLAFRLRPYLGSAPIPCLQALRDIWAHTKQTQWIAKLPESFSRNGFNIVTDETYSEHQHQRHMITDLWCLIADEHATMLEQYGPPERANQVKQLAIGAHAEIQLGSYVSHVIRVVVGRVPGK